MFPEITFRVFHSLLNPLECVLNTATMLNFYHGALHALYVYKYKRFRILPVKSKSHVLVVVYQPQPYNGVQGVPRNIEIWPGIGGASTRQDFPLSGTEATRLGIPARKGTGQTMR